MDALYPLAMRAIILAALLAAAAWAPPAVAGEPLPASVEGAALVIDGDTIWIGDHKICLGGINAPEMSERDGLYARAALQDFIAGRPVVCEIIEPKRDRYKRLIGRCRAGPTPLAAAMVSAGWAWPLPQYAGDRYDQAEAEAKAARRGVWAGAPEGERERGFWGWVERYQTGLGAVVGLIGVAFVVWLNAWSTRRRDNRLRDQDAKALASALSAELFVFVSFVKSSREAYQREYEDGKPFNVILIEESITPPPEVYKEHISDLTLLPPVLARRVVAFYAILGKLNQTCRLCCRTAGPADEVGFAYKSLADQAGSAVRMGSKALIMIEDFLAGRPLPALNFAAMEDMLAPAADDPPEDS